MMGSGLGSSLIQLMFNKHLQCVRLLLGSVSEINMALGLTKLLCY